MEIIYAMAFPRSAGNVPANIANISWMDMVGYSKYFAVRYAFLIKFLITSSTITSLHLRNYARIFLM